MVWGVFRSKGYACDHLAGSESLPIVPVIGPYAPAVLRFEVVFPLDYPEYPPTVRFTSDIFHPLVAPLTAYTYFVGTSSTKPVSAGGDASLAPGAFNLPNKFSTRCRWSQESAPVSTVPQTIINRSQKDCIYNHRDSSDTPHPPNPALDASQKGRKAAVAFGVRDILEHIKQAFDDEKVLDDLPAEAAANPGAWKAWKAHRQGSQATLDAQKGLQSVDNHSLSVGQGDGWNWDGVWHERVQKGIKASISDPVLYGSSSIGDPVSLSQDYVANMC